MKIKLMEGIRRKFFYYPVVLVSLFFVLNLHGNSVKDRLYFTGTKVLTPSTMDKNKEFVSDADKIIDAELFASRVMPFPAKKQKDDLKESLSKCQDTKCIIQEAKKAGVVLVAVSEISFFSDSFKGMLKMIDADSGITVAEVVKTAKAEKPVEVYSVMTKELVKASRYYFSLKRISRSIDEIEGFNVSPFNPVVDLSTVVSAVSKNDEKKPEESKLITPEQMSEFHDLSNEKNKELIKTYENALRADRFGESDPQAASDGWKAVISLSLDGGLKDFSIKRSNDWHYFAKETKDRMLFNQIVAMEEENKLSPDVIVKLWQEYLASDPKAERGEYAKKRIELFSGGADLVNRYLTEKRMLYDSAKEAFSKNLETMGAESQVIEKKIDIILKFLESYGVVDADFTFIEGLIIKIPDENDRSAARASVFNKWTAEFFKNKCVSGQHQSCINAEKLYRKLEMSNESLKLQYDGCGKKIVELCTLSDQSKLGKPDDSTIGITAEEVTTAASESVKTDKKKEKTGNEFSKTHPYFWYGFTSSAAAVALGAISVYYGVASNRKFSSYNGKIDNLIKGKDEFQGYTDKEKISIIKKTDNLLNEGDRYRTIAVGTGVAAGTLFVTGLILMAIKKPELGKKTAIVFVPSKEGFFLGASFEY